jgi:hypothetical protein
MDYMEKRSISDDGTIEGLVSSELRHIPRYRKLGPAARRLVASSKIDLKTAESLASVPDAAFEALDPLLESSSFSERRIILKTFAEIVKRDRMDETAALALSRDLGAKKMAPDKLHRLRYPELSSLEDRFEAVASRALKGSGITLKPPPFFEGLRYGISFEFDSGRTLKKKIRALENLAAEEDELFDLL